MQLVLWGSFARGRFRTDALMVLCFMFDAACCMSVCQHVGYAYLLYLLIIGVMVMPICFVLLIMCFVCLCLIM